MAKRSASGRDNRSDDGLWVATALPGLEDLLRAEIGRRLRRNVTFVDHDRPGECHFRYGGRPRALLSLRLCQTLSRRRDFPVARPRTLLSPEHLAALVRDMAAVNFCDE